MTMPNAMFLLNEPLASDTQILNLEHNYVHAQAHRQTISTIGDMTIERHERKLGRIVYYAVKDGRPLAYVFGHAQIRAGRRDRFKISSTFVRPESRRQGVGKAIYLAIIDYGEVLVSDWDQTEGAIALWQSLLASEPYGDVLTFQGGYVARRRRHKSISSKILNP